MNRIRFMALVAFYIIRPGIAPAGDLAAEVRTVFAARCAACHGPDLAKPKGRFGYVLNLARVACDPEKIIRGAPNESELWELVRRGEMPPEDSPTGPLTADQKETIRGWIAAGAPAGGSQPPTAGDAPPAAPLTNGGPAESLPLKEFLRQLGRLHVVLVHFPIALLIAAAAGEVWSMLRDRRTPAPAVHFCVILGAVGAVVAAGLGWLDAWSGAGAGQSALDLHRWIGTAAAGWAMVTAGLSARDEWRCIRSNRFRVALVIGAALVGAAGHFGGILVYGADFFTAL
jgi:uncharacterized membrane protein/mono/diheme cytochrome c family protein